MSINRHQKGSMLISVLFIMVLLSALIAAAIILSNQSRKQTVHEYQMINARLAAESVMQQQMYSLSLSITAPIHYKESDALVVGDCRSYIHSLEASSAEFVGVTQIERVQQVNVTSIGVCNAGPHVATHNVKSEIGHRVYEDVPVEEEEGG